ncbi:MAG TPA: hypothetical protein VG294_02130 [Solirubrobacteraceae bacterium]|jgi:hypothetical protein|nr:hypothetical protein [Solirubrobacteraceae bacterium]
MDENLLIVLSVVEIILLVAVLAVFLLVIAGQLRGIVAILQEVTWGARAVERQLKAAPDNVAKVNRVLGETAGLISAAADKAERFTIGGRR